LVNEQAKQGYLIFSNGRILLTKLGAEKLKIILNPDLARSSEVVKSHMKVNGISHAVSLNTSESPLYRLYCRKGKDGLAFISHDEFQAGERLRGDFERGQLQPKISASLNAGLGSSGRSVAVDISDFAIDARERVRKALDSLGPELSSVTLDICCFLKGLELVERERKWPPRSAKLMLKTGLSALARHYGMGRTNTETRNQQYFWGTSNYRPNIV